MLRVYLLCIMLITGILSGCGADKVPPDDGLYRKQANEPEISVYMHKTGAVEKMGMEKYLEGVVAGEMRNDWNLNALAAQAIIARTFTLQSYERDNLTSQGTHASTDIQEFQAYDATAVNDKVKQAVAMTRGKVAVYKGVPIIAWFHASAGGQTAVAKEGLDYRYEEPAYIQSVKSPDDLAPSDVQKWTAVFSQDEMEEALDELEIDVDSVDSIEIRRKGSSGRAELIVVNGGTEISAQRLRLALGSIKLKSMLLDEITMNNGQITFKGRGYGHGVGMSQWGAQKLAIDGKSPEDIVKYYFKDIQIEKRW